MVGVSWVHNAQVEVVVAAFHEGVLGVGAQVALAAAQQGGWGRWCGTRLCAHASNALWLAGDGWQPLLAQWCGIVR